MITLNTYRLNLNKIVSLLVFFQLFFSCSNNKHENKKEDIEIKIIRKEKIGVNNLIITLSFKNNSPNNYVIPNYLGYFLVYTMKENQHYDNSGKIAGNIISSEFSDHLDEKYLELFTSYYNKTFY